MSIELQLKEQSPALGRSDANEDLEEYGLDFCQRLVRAWGFLSDPYPTPYSKAYEQVVRAAEQG